MAYFPKYITLFNFQKFINLNKTIDVKMKGNVQYFGSFQVFYVWLGYSTLYTSRKSLIGAKMIKQG